jgi:hypothetical protein
MLHDLREPAGSGIAGERRRVRNGSIVVSHTARRCGSVTVSMALSCRDQNRSIAQAKGDPDKGFPRYAGLSP